MNIDHITSNNNIIINRKFRKHIHLILFYFTLLAVKSFGIFPKQRIFFSFGVICFELIYFCIIKPVAPIKMQT